MATTPEILIGGQPNVGLFSWTSNDMTSVKDIVTYVQAAMAAAEAAQAAASVAEDAKNEVNNTKASYDLIINTINQQYIDMTELSNQMSQDVASLNVLVGDVNNVKTSVDISYAQMSIWNQENRAYHLLSVYQFVEENPGSSDLEVSVTRGAVQRITLTSGETNFSVNSFSDGSDKARQLTLILKQGTGSNKVKWPSNIHWNNERAPNLSYVQGRSDIVTILTHDSGANWYGFFNGGWFNV